MLRRSEHFRQMVFVSAAGFVAAVLATSSVWAQTYGSSSGAKSGSSTDSSKTTQTDQGKAATSDAKNNTARDAAREARDTSRDSTRDARESARETASDARDTARDAARETRESAREAGREARDTAREGREGAREMSRDARQTARETGQGARDSLRDTRDRFREERDFADRDGDGDRDDRNTVRSEARDAFRDTARDAREFGREAARDAIRTGQETARDALDTARESNRFSDRDDREWRDFGRDTERRWSDLGRDLERNTRSVMRDDDRFDRDDRFSDERSNRDDRDFRDRDSRDSVSREMRDRDFRSTERFSDSRRNGERISRSQIQNFRASTVDPSDLGLRLARSSRGLFVDSIESNALASTIGLRADDRIVSVGDYRVTSPDQFVRYLFDDEWRFDRVPVYVVRDGREVPLYVRPVELIEELVVVRDDYDPVRRFGVVIDNQYDDYVVVRRVLPNTPAFDAGLRTGDVITTWQGQRIASPLEFSRVLGRVDTNDVALGIRRDRQARSIDVSLPREFIRTSSGRRTTFRQDLDADRWNRGGTTIERRDVRPGSVRVEGSFEPMPVQPGAVVPGQPVQPAQPVEDRPARPGLMQRILGR